MNGSESFDLTGTGEARALACVRAGVCLWVSVLFVWVSWWELNLGALLCFFLWGTSLCVRVCLFLVL